jgi:hypothetical protein
MSEEVCFDKLQESLINKYNKSWSGTGIGKLLRSLPYKSQLVVYVENNVVSYSSEVFYDKAYPDDKVYQHYTPTFENGEFKFPIFEEQSEDYSEEYSKNTTEPTKGYTILPAKIALPAGEYTKKDLLGFINML